MPSVLPLLVGVVPPFLLVVTPFNGDTKNIQLGVRMASMIHQNQSAHFPTSRATRRNLNEMVTSVLCCGVRMSYCQYGKEEHQISAQFWSPVLAHPATNEMLLKIFQLARFPKSVACQTVLLSM